MQTRHLLLLPFLTFVFGACSKTDNVKNAEMAQISKMKSQLAGSWKEIDPCKDCSTIYFTPEVLEYNSVYENVKESMPYSCLSGDSISTKRTLNSILVQTRHKILFRKDGSLEIMNFVVGGEAYPGRYAGDVAHFHSMILEKQK